MPNKRCPWSAIGRTFPKGCTGSLVARDLVLTNAHCVMVTEEDKEKYGKKVGELLELDQLGFYLDYTEHNSGLLSRVIELHVSPEYLRGDDNSDWAILRLSSPIGDSHGWLGIVPSKAEEHVTLAGYSGDIREGHIATIDRTCRTFVEEWDVVTHNCDNWYGASGGPLFRENNGSYSIVGLHKGAKQVSAEIWDKLQQFKATPKEFYKQVGELKYGRDGRNGAVQTQRFAEKVRELANISSRN